VSRHKRGLYHAWILVCALCVMLVSLPFAALLVEVQHLYRWPEVMVPVACGDGDLYVKKKKKGREKWRPEARAARRESMGCGGDVGCEMWGMCIPTMPSINDAFVDNSL
jgi:hypothetical protein